MVASGALGLGVVILNVIVVVHGTTRVVASSPFIDMAFGYSDTAAFHDHESLELHASGVCCARQIMSSYLDEQTLIGVVSGAATACVDTAARLSVEVCQRHLAVWITSPSIRAAERCKIIS
ncbi:hypothetical protein CAUPRSCDRAFT_12639 [Caulochytrium protostelioides]|uniref:Uncharacterized protein n=1 Tax=Caulochytrium protostelioides TaxID=1555241 RepID=A0A4P9WR36_9FUNG|nr:hypothetical protein CAUPRSCDRAFT_12639 [Caulochytrium protostelioides]